MDSSTPGHIYPGIYVTDNATAHLGDVHHHYLVRDLGGVVSFGLQVCKGMTNYYAAYSNAEDDVEYLCHETNALMQTLTSFKEAIQDSRVNINAEATLDTSIESCKARITELDTELKKFNFKRDGRRSMRSVMSRTVRASYPFQANTICKLRENISRINEILQQGANSILIRQNNVIQDTIDRFYAKEASKDIMRWLDPPSPVHSHLDASAKHRQNTGSWLLDSARFKEWKESSSSVLWVQGNAGCGKTVLCSTIIDRLLEECESKANSGIAYFYFDFNNQSVAQDHNRLLRSLIEQLSSQSGDVPPALASLYQRSRKGSVQPMTSDLLKAFHNIIGGLSLFYLIIDAVDESKEKQEFLKFLNTVAQWPLPHVHVLATSRTDIDTEIRNRKWSCVTVTVEERLVDADIEKHVFATLDDDEILNRWDRSQQQLIATSLIKGANGNFRWVACQIGALRECHTLAELEDVLNYLPATLEETYERALAAIDDQRREFMKNIFKWLSFSARPLRLEEIAEVMAVDFSAAPQPKYDVRKRLIDPQRFFQGYSNLVHILSVKTKGVEYREVRLAHLSVRDYLVSSKIRTGPVAFYAVDSLSAHTSIAQTCLVYLRQFDKPLAALAESLESYPLARYAAKYWPQHVQAVAGAAEMYLPAPTDQALQNSSIDQSTPLIALIVELLLQILKVLSLSSSSIQVRNLPADLNNLCTELLSAQDAQLENQIRFYDPDTPWIEQPDIARALNALPSALYYAAHSGLVGSVKLLLAKGMDVNATGGRYGSTLQAAACKGHIEVIKVLLANQADVNQVGGEYGNALQGACSYGHRNCAELLIEHGAEINARGGEHTTALHAAAYSGHDQVAALLLRSGAEVDPLDEEHRTPLIWAAGEGHPETVRLLLDHGADCMAQDEGGWTALDDAAPAGYDSIVRMLINHRPHIIHSKDITNYTSLHHTAGQRHDSTMKILLESGVDVNAQTTYGHTALFAAVASGHEESVRLLLKHGANIHITNDDGWNVLHVAAFYGHVSVGALLLDHGADIDCQNDGMTPLHIGVLKKDADVVELLLEYDADIMIQNDYGYTTWELLHLHEVGEADLILEDLDIESPTTTITGLRVAACHGHDVRIRQLLERGADVDAKDESRMTALLYACKKGYTSIAKLLIENGADVNVKSDSGTTPMSYIRGNAELEALLLANGYNLDTPDSELEETAGQQDDDASLRDIRVLLEERIMERSTTTKTL